MIGADPFVEVSLYVPDCAAISSALFASSTPSAPPSPSNNNSLMPTTTLRTSVVKNNSFNPVWDETLVLKFEILGDMMDLAFVRFEVRDRELSGGGEGGCMGVFCAALASMREGESH